MKQVTLSIHYWIVSMALFSLCLTGCETTANNKTTSSDLRPSADAPYQSKAYKIYWDKNYYFLSQRFYTATRLNQIVNLDPEILKVTDYCTIMEFCNHYDSIEKKQKKYQSQYVQQVLTKHETLRRQLQNLYEYEKHIQRYSVLGSTWPNKGKWIANEYPNLYRIGDNTRFLTLLHVERISQKLTKSTPAGWETSIPIINESLWSRASSGTASVYDVQKVETLDDLLSNLEQRYEHTRSYAQQTKNSLILDFLPEAKSKLDDLKEFIGQTKQYYNPYLEQAAVDRARRDAKISLTQKHLIKSYVARHLPEDRFKISPKTGVAIESVITHGNYIDIQIRHFELNYSTSKFGSVMVYYEGVNLGSPVDKKTLLLPIRSDKNNPDIGMIKETVYQYRFKAERSLAQNGKINVQLRCPEIRLDSTINYTAAQEASISPDLANTASYFSGVITCRRGGNHLFVPTSFNIHGESVAAELLLDTGASSTCISEQLYKRGNFKSLTSLSRIKLSTANGDVHVPTDRMEVMVGGMKKNLMVSIFADNICLLGVDFFEGYTYTIDVDKARILVSPTI